ncbi:MAG: aminotransferase class I/II-fold pyridoxal phosphate-dependent enzyme [Symbiobacteriaceae bacterium]|nr:aminotransferase class I/II-fold pyridoxal phosphate-dependent enzyme [Symbiobacteriaceae bacterium]
MREKGVYSKKDQEMALGNDELICAHLGDEYEKFMGAVIPPLFQNSLHVHPDVETMWSPAPGSFVYARVANPTTDIFERKVAALERGEKAVAFASGMGAITASILAAVSCGGHFIGVEGMYGPTRTFVQDFFPKIGVEATFITGSDINELKAAIRPNTQCIYLESPSSVALRMQDIPGIAAIAREHGIATVIDNSWASPIYQKPLTMGIDMVVHTVSKYIGGHSDIVAGISCGSAEWMAKVSKNREIYGAMMGPFESWLAIRGLRTLPLRLKAAMASGLKVANFLEQHPMVERVVYPGLPSHPDYALGQKQLSGYGSLMSFVPKGDLEEAKAFANRLTWFKLGVSWGGFESLITVSRYNPSLEEQERRGVYPRMIRIYVGLEDVDALIADLDQSLNQIKL